MGGILGTGQQMQGQAISGLRRASEVESQRDAANEQIEAGEKAQKVNTTASGAGTGAAIGAGIGIAQGAAYGGVAGPVGMLVGAIAGYLLSEVF